jgi:hypothetical protein
MAINPDKSIPQIFLNSYDVKAAYTFSAIRKQRLRICKKLIVKW